MGCCWRPLLNPDDAKNLLFIGLHHLLEMLLPPIRTVSSVASPSPRSAPSPLLALSSHSPSPASSVASRSLPSSPPSLPLKSSPTPCSRRRLRQRGRLKNEIFFSYGGRICSDPAVDPRKGSSNHGGAVMPLLPR